MLTFIPTSKMWGGMMWPSLETTPKAITVARNCFHHPGHVPVICGNPDLHFEGAGNGPVVITWIGREHVLYSGASPISLVEHSVTFRHDRRLLSLLRFVHNWPTSWWSATKKENQFSLNRNGIMSSFLWQQFYHSTLCVWYIYIYIYIYIKKHICMHPIYWCISIYIYIYIYIVFHQRLQCSQHMKTFC